MTAGQVAALGSGQLAALTTDQVASLTHASITAFATAQMAGWTTTQIASLTTSQITAREMAVSVALTNSQTSAFTMAHTSVMTNDQISALFLLPCAGHPNQMPGGLCRKAMVNCGSFMFHPALPLNHVSGLWHNALPPVVRKQVRQIKLQTGPYFREGDIIRYRSLRSSALFAQSACGEQADHYQRQGYAKRGADAPMGRDGAQQRRTDQEQHESKLRQSRDVQG